MRANEFETSKNFEKGLDLLKRAYGNEAQFHAGQWESIDAILKRERTLVVQRTGWGKSLVYFIATRILRDLGQGPTIVISPLLALMRNQDLNAQKFGIQILLINSETLKETPINDMKQLVEQGHVDLIMTTPEQVGTPEFAEHFLSQTRISLFVVDEAHCISDWGHDFRPDYRRISRVIELLPKNIPVLATTATANDRVIADIQRQLGVLNIQRGPLTRDSLYLQAFSLPNFSERMAWLAENIPEIPGSGIIYCLTKADCVRLSSWLKSNGINAEAYHSDIQPETKKDLERALLDNSIKALVATTAISMGFDKSDLAFVIHYQRPQNLITYYQQVGRAGRGIERAYGILLSGQEDEEIIDYFINNAFASEEDISSILSALSKSAKGLNLTQLLNHINIGQNKTKNILKNLIVDQLVGKEKSIYSRTLSPWNPDHAHIEEITRLRWFEKYQVSEYINSDQCLMMYLANVLNDPNTKPCGHCVNCLKTDFFPRTVSLRKVEEAELFQKHQLYSIQPKQKWPNGFIEPKGNINRPNEPGKFLSYYNDQGWGKLVSEDKYKTGVFRDELVLESARVINEWVSSEINFISFVPSLNHPLLVSEFAHKLANHLGITCLELISKRPAMRSQKEMENSQQQCRNAINGFYLNSLELSKIDAQLSDLNVLLIDDIIDSGWTLTVIGDMLTNLGFAKVYPFALASAGKQ